MTSELIKCVICIHGIMYTSLFFYPVSFDAYVRFLFPPPSTFASPLLFFLGGIVIAYTGH